MPLDMHVFNVQVVRVAHQGLGHELFVKVPRGYNLGVNVRQDTCGLSVQTIMLCPRVLLACDLWLPDRMRSVDSVKYT